MSYLKETLKNWLKEKCLCEETTDEIEEDNFQMMVTAEVPAYFNNYLKFATQRKLQKNIQTLSKRSLKKCISKSEIPLQVPVFPKQIVTTSTIDNTFIEQKICKNNNNFKKKSGNFPLESIKQKILINNQTSTIKQAIKKNSNKNTNKQAENVQLRNEIGLNNLKKTLIASTLKSYWLPSIISSNQNQQPQSRIQNNAQDSKIVTPINLFHIKPQTISLQNSSARNQSSHVVHWWDLRISNNLDQLIINNHNHIKPVLKHSYKNTIRPQVDQFPRFSV